MVKSKKVWSVTAGFIGAAGLAALATGANTVSASTGTVNYKTGATTVWNSPSWHQVKRYMTFGDTVQLLGKTVDQNGATWYKVGENQWIPELYLNVDGKTAKVEAPASTASQAPTSQAPASQAPSSQAATTAQAPAQNANIQLYVKNVGSAVTVWATPAYGRATGQYLEGRQSLTAVAQQQANGETWYQLANGGYVPARFVSTTPVAAAPQSTAPQSVASSAAAQPAQSTASQAPVSSAAAQPTSQAPASQAPASSAAPQASQAPAASSQAPASSTAAQPSQAPAASQAPASSAATPAAQPSQAPASSAAPQAQTVQVNNTNANNNSQAQQPATYSAPVAPAATDTSRQAKVQAVIAVAEQQIGKPYIWGGKGPTGFDCSGLMYYAFLHGAGVNIGGWTVPQESSGQPVSLGALQPGDLLFWGGHGSTYHVALYIGGGNMIQAPQPGENVKYTALAYFQPDFAVRPNL